MRKTKIRFFTIADYEEEEVWLREQHRQGWKIVRMTPPCVYTFESCEPQDVIYRLDFRNNAETGTYMQMLRDFGWEPFARCMGWLYFRKPAAEAESEADGELFSDDASRAELAAKVVKTRLLPLMFIFLFCVIPNLVRFAAGGDAGPVGVVFTAVFGVLFAVYVFLIVYCGTKLRRIRSRYQSGG